MPERSRKESRLDRLMFEALPWIYLGAVMLGSVVTLSYCYCVSSACYSAMQNGQVERINPEELPRYNVNQNSEGQEGERNYSP